MNNLAQDQFIGRVSEHGRSREATIGAAAWYVLDDTIDAAMINTPDGARSKGSGGLVGQHHHQRQANRHR